MYLKSFAYFLSSFLICSAQKSVNQECSSPSGNPGVCVYMNECKAAIDSYEAKGFHDLERCGFEGMTEIVCCLKDEKTHNFKDRSDDEAAVNGHASGGVVPPRPLATATRIEKRRSEIECAHIIETLQPPLDDHIIGGNDTREGEFPHMVAIGYVKETQTKTSFICGGTLISPKFVMTAAHCIKLNKAFPDMKPTVARIGVIDLTDASDFNEKTDYAIIETIAHPNYTIHYYDIGLLKLSKPVTYTLTAHAACLFNKNEPPNTVTVTGWGINNWETRQRSTKLQKLDIKVVSNAECTEHYKKFRTINRGIVNEMICAGGVLGQDSCQGDSGGPLQAITEADGHYRIVGITSFGRACGTEIPGVYTKVSSYLDWIENIVWPLAA